MNKTQLRDYQLKLISDIRQSIAGGHRKIVSVLGCGGGKSIVQAEISRLATAKHNRVQFLVHRKELCQQIAETFTRQGVNMSLCSVDMVQTVSRHIDRMEKPAVIITDEAHHSIANTYRKIYDAFPAACMLGFTATPCRLNSGGLGDVYDNLITSVSTKWLIDHNYLSPYKYYSVRLVNTSGLHIRAGEYKSDEVAALMQRKDIYGKTVEQWERLAKGKKTIVYCASVESAKETAAQFKRCGYAAASLDGKTSPELRRSIMESFRSGDIRILCNCELFGEGLDVPDCECTVLLRPTQSLTLFIQQSMRSMRYMPGKTAIIIDHVGNCYLHGLPDDSREWTLEPKHRQENIVKIRECPECFAVYPPTLNECPYCGYEAVREVQRKDKQIIDVDLVEIRRQEDIRNTPYNSLAPQTWADIIEIQRARGYKIQWAVRYAVARGIPIPRKYSYMRRVIGV